VSVTEYGGGGGGGGYAGVLPALPGSRRARPRQPAPGRAPALGVGCRRRGGPARRRGRRSARPVPRLRCGVARTRQRAPCATGGVRAGFFAGTAAATGPHTAAHTFLPR